MAKKLNKMAQQLSDEAATGCWETARLSPAVVEHEKLVQEGKAEQIDLVFGYGSILFKIDFPYEEKFNCVLLDEGGEDGKSSGDESQSGGSSGAGSGPRESFQRRFWMQSVDHRGTTAFPGRVVTLVKLPAEAGVKGPKAAAGVTCPGVAVRIPSDEATRTKLLKDLDYRERHGYTRTIASVRELGGGQDGDAPKTHKCYVYFYDTSGEGDAAAGGGLSPGLSRGDSISGHSLSAAVSTGSVHDSDPDVATCMTGSALVWSEPIYITAGVIAKAVGPSGRNIEYLTKVVKAIREIVDAAPSLDAETTDLAYLNALLQMVEAMPGAS